jgi:hypothetical protein
MKGKPMSNPTATDAGASFDLGPGLIEFYSSQATLMLAQYHNIEHLLGPTDDWTAPGTHCEVLLRNLLRAYLPGFYQVDKGFMYGRRKVADATVHCPEIDILVHDNHHFRPILQIDDFVIAQAKATYAAIQVKRRMDTAQLRDALANVADAKDHFRWMCQKSARSPLTFFSAVVFFDEKSPRNDGRPSETYRNCIEETFTDPTTWYLAPDFVGSFQNHVYYRDQYGDNRLRYVGYPSNPKSQNIAVQILLWKITQILGPVGCDLPFSFPNIQSSDVDFIEITKLAPTSSTSGSEPPLS